MLKKYSLITLGLCFAAIAIFRLTHINQKELSWDVLGYYLYLPATFIHHDPLLNDITWLQKINESNQLTGTLYQITSNKEGQSMYFFLMGMALLYLPFFFIGHLWAGLGHFPMDGFSQPYQVSMVIGGLFYTLVGLIFFRKLLLRFLNEKTASYVLLIIVFGTNYSHHLTLKNLETVNVIFMLVAWITWVTIQWHEEHKWYQMIFIGAGVTMAGMVKPSEVLIILIPLLWKVDSRIAFIEKIQLLKSYSRQIIVTIGCCSLLVFPQLLYWQVKTGFFIFDSYQNPGVGLDLWSPHLFDSLFSYRKGWLLYTPVMIFALLGMIPFYKKNRQAFIPVGIYMILSFYVIISWSEWWYGAGFSNRPVIALYPFLGIALGFSFLEIEQKKGWVKLGTTLLILGFVLLNQFQWWQLRNYILDPYRTTKEYYWATFLKTHQPANAEELKLIYRDFSGNQKFELSDTYAKKNLLAEDFSNITDVRVCKDSTGNAFYRINSSDEFSLLQKFKYKKITKKDHLWVKVNFDIRTADSLKNNGPYMVITMQRLNGSYGYYAPDIAQINSRNEWVHMEYDYLTPEIRSGYDQIQFYFWNPNQQFFDIDNLLIEVFERKD